MFDLKQEPFTDQMVREAFAYGFDRETYCAEIRSGDCVPTFSWIPPGVPGHIDTDAFAFDPDKARQALADSSYRSGGEPAGDQVLLPERRPHGDPACGVVGPALSGGARHRTHPGASRQRHVYGNGEGLGDLPADIAPQLGPGLSRSSELAQHLLDMRLDDLRRSGQLLQRGLDALVRQADVELDADQRIALYEEAGQLLVVDAPAVFAFNLAAVVLIKPEVTGYQATASDYFYPASGPR